ncbi:unnamed protein product [Colias eurytheme]|nr:unnamed protein product [Colias eurytheme]
MSRALESRKANVKTNKDNFYTVFSPMSIKLKDIPNSPYFNGDVNDGYKTRVKKVLPEFEHKIHKRSATVNETNLESRRSESKLHGAKRKHSDNNADHVKSHRLSKDKKHEGKSSKHKHHKRHHQMKLPREANKTKELRSHKKKSKSHHSRKLKSKSSRRDKVKLLHEDKTLRSGKALIRRKRLIAAKDAMIEDYPYVVSIQKGREHWCSGALLNPRLVITTANCIWKSFRMSRLKVRAGSRYVDRGGQLAKVQEVMKHPYWSIRKNPDYDVGLLYLDRNIRFSDSVHAVDLPNDAMLPAFEDAWVTSWGAERRDGVFETKGITLQVYHSRLIDLDKCNNVTQRFGVAVTNNFICLAQTGRRAPCTRDTGAPAVSDGIVWGLASWGLRKLCGTERYPAMFSYLGSRSNLDFITNATHFLLSEKRYYPYPDRFVLNKADTTKPPTTSNIMEY